MVNPEFFHGVLPGTLSRFTEKQLERYSSLGEARLLRARCLSGAFLGVASQSRKVEITLAVRGRARQNPDLDLEVDGVPVRSIRLNLDQETQQITVALAEFSESREREIRVYLPVAQEVEVADFTPDGEPLKKPGKKLLCLGDSITQGMDATSPACTYPVVLARLLDAELLNQGVGGQTFDELTLDARLPFPADFVTVAYGVNDWYQGLFLKEIEAAVCAYLKKLKQIFPQAFLVVITPLWTVLENQVKNAGTLQSVRDLLMEKTQAAGCLPVSGLTLVPHDPFYFVDGLHPNETGHLLYGLNLYRHLKKMCPATGGKKWLRKRFR